MNCGFESYNKKYNNLRKKMGFEEVVYLDFNENRRTNKEKRCVLSKLWIWFVIELKEKEI